MLCITSGNCQWSIFSFFHCSSKFESIEAKGLACSLYSGSCGINSITWWTSGVSFSSYNQELRILCALNVHKVWKKHRWALHCLFCDQVKYIMSSRAPGNMAYYHKMLQQFIWAGMVAKSIAQYVCGPEVLDEGIVWCWKKVTPSMGGLLLPDVW